MKRYLIILAFLPLISSGQYQTPDTLWNGTINVVGSDTLLYDSVNAVNTGIRLIQYTGAINSGYLDLTETGYLIFNNTDTITIQEAGSLGRRNYLDGDTLFIQSTAQAINADSSQSLPARLTRIARYVTPTTDVNNYWQSLEVTGTMLDAGTGRTYSTLQAADNASSSGDTILWYQGIEPNSTSITDGKTVIFMGNGYITGTTNYKITINSSQNVKLIGVRVETSNSYAVALLGTGTHIIENGYHVGGILDYTGAGGDYTIKDSYINGRVSINTDLTLERSVIESPSFSLAVQNNHKYNVRYSKLKSPTSNIYLGNSGAFNVHSIGNTYYSKMFNVSAMTEVFYYYSKLDTYDKQVSDIMINVLGGLGEFTFKRCLFKQTQADAVNDYLYITDAGSLTIDSCFFDNLQTRCRVVATGVFNVEFTNDTVVNTDYEVGFILEGVNANIENSYISADLSHYVDIYSTTHDIDVNVTDNTFIVKLGAGYTVTPPPLSVGTLEDELYADTAYVADNLFIGPYIYGNGAGAGLHGISIGALKHSIIERNNVRGFPLALVSKSTDIDVTGQLWQYNVIDTCTHGITIRGSYNCTANNNTFKVNTSGLNLAVNETLPTSYTENTTFKNNIIYSYDHCIVSDSSENLTGIDSDHNIMYSVNETAFVNFVNYNFSGWQSLISQDANSYNSDPQLNANGVPGTGSPAIGNGLNLGSPYNIGLVPNTTFPNPSTTTQKALWTIGAYITNLNRTVTSNFIILSGNKFTKY